MTTTSLPDATQLLADDPADGRATEHHGRIRRRQRGAGRRAARLALVAASLVTAGTAVTFTGAGTASARPNCDVEDPPLICGPRVPEPPPQPASWNISVKPLVLDPARIGTVTTDRSWLGADGSTPAGTAAGTGTLKFPLSALPVGSQMALSMRETGSSGSLCRTAPSAALPPSGTPLHLLVPEPVIVSASTLASMAHSFVGPQANTPPDVAVDIDSAKLVPGPVGVQVQLNGRLVVGPSHFSFTYALTLRLVPANGVAADENAAADPKVVLVEAAPGESLSLKWLSTPPADNPGGVLALFQAHFRPALHKAVVQQAGAAVDDAVTQRPDLTWWTSQGYRVSMRSITSSTSGITMAPSLCKLG